MAAKRGRGRPSKLTDEAIEAIATALSIGATHEIAANYAGVSAGCFYHWKHLGEMVYDRLQDEYYKESESLVAIQKAKKAKQPLPEPYEPEADITAEEARYLKFYETIMEAEATGAVAHLNFLHKAAPTDPKSSQWLLQNRYGYGSVQKVEMTGKDGGPIETKGVDDMSLEERAARIVYLMQRAQERMDTQTAVGEDGADAPPT